jgi:hypothetical protein
MERYTGVKKTLEQVGGKGLIEQLQVSIKIYDQRDKLPPQIVDYHMGIINYWATFMRLYGSEGQEVGQE